MLSSLGGFIICYFAIDKALIMISHSDANMSSIITAFKVDDKNKVDMYGPTMLKPTLTITE